MSAWWAAVALVVPALPMVVVRCIELCLLWRAYRRGDVRALKAFAAALRDTRPSTVTETLARARRELPRGRDQGEQ